ncbi:hypothetical protein BN1263170302 [Stenotrophomonas maltophilia]|nr:hypothetical protein BN1263170302 [Stenotrophomonas maltophilia]
MRHILTRVWGHRDSMLPFRYTSVSPSTTPSLWSPSWPATRTCLEGFLVGYDLIVAQVRPGNHGWSTGMTTLGAVLAAVLDAAVLAAVLGLAGISWVNARHASGDLRERYRWRAQSWPVWHRPGCSPWRGCPREPTTLRANCRSRATGAERPA